MKVELSLNCNGTWVDYSAWVDVSEMKVNKSLDSANDPTRSQTSSIVLQGEAYQYFRTNIIESPNIYSNSICVRITDSVCGGEYIYKADNRNLKWCENGECKLSLDLEEYSPELDCIANTLLSNNEYGLFQLYPVTGNPHPRFRYCDIIKPTWFFGMLVTFFNSFDLFIVFIDTLIITLNSGFNIINAAIGTSLPTIGTINLITDKWLGCGRGYPAPFIRTYIDNVCNICGGIDINSETAPILYTEESRYYNACLLTAYSKKGVDMDGNRDYIMANSPSWTLRDLFSKIKDFWNARWFYYDNTLYFERKDLIGELIWGAGVYHIDFTTGDDKDNLQSDICFAWNGEGKPSRINMNYGTDASDAIGNENLIRFNGEWLDSSGNPNYNGSIKRDLIEFGAPSFVLDGQDSLYDANIVKAVGSVLSNMKFGGCLKTMADTCQLAKILVYDDATDIEDARTVGTPYFPYASLSEFDDDNAVHFPIAITDVYNYNYAFSFSPAANGISNNLWPYHAIDMPSDSKKTNISFEFKLKYCCAYNALDLYQSVKFENGWDGEINYIDFDFANRLVIVKGNVK